jgi:hypothetical protein
VEVRLTRVILDGTPFDIYDENLQFLVPIIWERLVFDLKLPVPVRDKS